MPNACITNSDLSNPPHQALSPNDPCPLWNNSLNLALHPLQVLLLRFSAFPTLEALIPPPPPPVLPLLLLLLLVFPVFLPLLPNATQIASQVSTEAIISTMSFSPTPERRVEEEEILWIESKRIRENSRIRFGKLRCLRLRIRCFVDRRRR